NLDMRLPRESRPGVDGVSFQKRPADGVVLETAGFQAAEAVVDDEVIQIAPLQSRSPVLGKSVARVRVDLLEFLVVPRQESGDRLVEEVKTVTKLNDSPDHRWRTAKRGESFLSPAESPLGRVLPEIDAVA